MTSEWILLQVYHNRPVKVHKAARVAPDSASIKNPLELFYFIVVILLCIYSIVICYTKYEIHYEVLKIK